MIHLSRNKNELLVLTGAVYAFVAYIIAFTLEVLFLVDSIRRTSDLLSPAAKPITSESLDDASVFTNSAGPHAIASQLSVSAATTATTTNASTIFSLESMQAHIAISCLAIAILYFIIFIASLTLIVALILRSTFMLLMWMCAMTTMYLPEFGLVVYVSAYTWGLDTRNGQTELVFYLIRAVLNLIFIFRAHKLFREWSYEKNFFRLKSGSNFTGYDSPYFIGDSLTTTINPVFSTSTLDLNRYDRVRDTSNNTGSPRNISNYSNDYDNYNHQQHRSNRDNSSRSRLAAASMYSRDFANQGYSPKFNQTNLYNLNQLDSNNRESFYLGETRLTSNLMLKDSSEHRRPISHQPFKFQQQQIKSTNSTLSINDDFPEYELDLDYSTLSQPRKHDRVRPPSRQQHQQPISVQRIQPDRSPDSISYSTQSLDRRHLRDYILSDQVVLRPLGHQPFEYLQRPGSSSNLDSLSNLNTHPSLFSSQAKLTKRSDLKNGRY